MKSHRVLLAIGVVLGCAEFAGAQFQRSLIQPRRQRLSAAPADVLLTASCLDYGIRTPGERDVFASLSEGHGFLVRSDGGRIDLNECMKSGWVVLRGTGRDGEILAHVRTAGWDELEIRAGAQALPPRAREVDLSEATIHLLEQAAELERTLEGVPGDVQALLKRIEAGARQEHVWTTRSPSRQAIDPGLRRLPATLKAVGRLRRDASAVARLQWLLRRDLTERERKAVVNLAGEADAQRPGMSFLGGFLVLRAAPAEMPSSLEACSVEGIESVALAKAGIRRLQPALEAHATGQVILTEELAAAVERAGLWPVLETTLTAAGHRMVWRLPDDQLLLHEYQSEARVRRRFAVVAPGTGLEARALFGQSSLGAFAFNSLIEQGKVLQVRTREDLDRLHGADVVLVCRQRFGRIPLVDGSEIGMDELPAGAGPVVACDAINLRERLPLKGSGRGAFTYEGLATAVEAALVHDEAGEGLSRAELIESLAAGYANYWKRRGIPGAPLAGVRLSLAGDAWTLSANGSLLKLLGGPADRATR